MALLLAFMAWLVPAAAQSPDTHRHSFGDAQRWAQVFDDPKRDAWQKPHEVIQALALKPDAVIAELKGAGYRLAQEHRFLPNQYFLVFRPVIGG